MIKVILVAAENDNAAGSYKVLLADGALANFLESH